MGRPQFQLTDDQARILDGQLGDINVCQSASTRDIGTSPMNSFEHSITPLARPIVRQSIGTS